MSGITSGDLYRAAKGAVAMDSEIALDSLAVLLADQPVVHAGRRATFLHMSQGEAIIRYWGDSHDVAVPPETLTLRRTSRAARRLLEARDEPLSRDRPHT